MRLSEVDEGYILEFLSDGGGEFYCAEVKKILFLEGIKKKRTFPSAIRANLVSIAVYDLNRAEKLSF